ncbi:MAG: hypothetical protein PHW83_11420 [Bacteroidales bacterium]|nr:hypothetical protein [Bacteroidales bacterium]
MKKFESNYYGLLPIYLADQRFIQDATAEQIEALIAPWLPYATANSFILTGVEPDIEIPTGYTPGWLVINGKIYRSNAFLATVVPAGQQRVWSIEENNIEGGAKIPKRSLTPVETWKEYTAKPILVSTEETEVIPFALPRLSDLITEIQRQTYFTRSGSTANGTYKLQFLQMKDGYVHCTGSLWPAMEKVSDPNVTCDIAVPVPFTLDSDFREGFDFLGQITIFGVDAIPGLPHHEQLNGYKVWVSFAPLVPFSFRISIEEITPYGYSDEHFGAIPVNFILKLA